MRKEKRSEMSSGIQVHPIMDKLGGFIDWLTNGRWQVIPAARVDELYTEIYQLEKTLANAPTRPMRLHKSRPLEPLTEQQKIMDLAG